MLRARVLMSSVCKKPPAWELLGFGPNHALLTATKRACEYIVPTVSHIYTQAMKGVEPPLILVHNYHASFTSTQKMCFHSCTL